MLAVRPGSQTQPRQHLSSSEFSKQGHTLKCRGSKGHLEMSRGGVRPICQLIESDKSLHVRIQIQVIEHTPGRAKMQIHLNQLKHLLVEDKCKFFQKIFEEQNYSDNSIRAAADFTVFPTLSLLSGGLVGP